MSSKNKFFSKKIIDPKGGDITGITAVNILDEHLITGNDKGKQFFFLFTHIKSLK